MQAKTKIQKEVVALSAQLPKISEKQTAHAYEYCVEHYAVRRKKGYLNCTECGVEYADNQSQLASALLGSVCPHCGAKLKVVDSRKKRSREMEYYSIMTTFRGWQVVRYFSVRIWREIGDKAVYDIDEVVQWWINGKGKTVCLAKNRQTMSYYYDLWIYGSELSVKDGTHISCTPTPYATYPSVRYIPELKRNGFKGKFHNISPIAFISGILKDPRKETLLKSGQISLLKWYCGRDVREWDSVKIALRNNYIVKDASMWTDHIRILRELGKDVRNAFYVCPSDLTAEHNRYLAKLEAKRMKERKEEERKKMAKYEEKYRKDKEKFFGLLITDGHITIRTLQSVEEIFEEGEAMHHCVYQCGYYKQEKSLILSARMDDKRLETIEVNLNDFSIAQSRGLLNKATEYHDDIVRLMKENMWMIRNACTPMRASA